MTKRENSWGRSDFPIDCFSGKGWKPVWDSRGRSDFPIDCFSGKGWKPVWDSRGRDCFKPVSCNAAAGSGLELLAPGGRMWRMVSAVNPDRSSGFGHLACFCP